MNARLLAVVLLAAPAALAPVTARPGELKRLIDSFEAFVAAHPMTPDPASLGGMLERDPQCGAISDGCTICYGTGANFTCTLPIACVKRPYECVGHAPETGAR